jgi:flagellar hook assembly protein FlgD
MLLQNYPNPFNPETWIPYKLNQTVNVDISIYNVNGQLVRMMRLGEKSPGNYVTKDKAAYWDGTNNKGERVASGAYFYQLKAGEKSFVRRMVIVK